MPRTRPLHPPSPRLGRLPLDRIVADVNAALGADGPDTLLRVAGDPPEVGFLSLDGLHPFTALVGLTAPHPWSAIGVHCHGWASALDAVAVTRQETASLPVLVTTLIDRSGRGAGVLRALEPTGLAPAGRAGGAVTTTTAADTPVVTRYDRAPDGLVGDACRRALGLPTAPPPASTAELWLRIWLDQALEEAWSCGGAPRAGWDALATLHPAARCPFLLSAVDGPVRLADPEALAETTLMLAEAWTWSRLRHDPELLALAGPTVSRQTAAWMDDGMFARAVLERLPTLAQATCDTAVRLPHPLQDGIERTIVATGLARRQAGHPGPATAERPEQQVNGHATS